MLRIGIVAGEASGDYLGADLICAIRKKIPDVIVEGIGGPKMEQAGCHLIAPMEKLSVMGFVEVLSHYFELLGIRSRLARHFIKKPPDIFIGIDAPDFNLGLEKKLHQHHIKTVHYVSPQVWAWRTYRVKKMASSVDLLLTLFPFEKVFYEGHNIRAVYVGHPLADKIELYPDKLAARSRLGLPRDKMIIAIMPGSRKMELNRLLEPFLLTADWCYKQDNSIHFISSLLGDKAADQFTDSVSRLSLAHLPLTFYKDRAHDVLEAADVVLLASGTITLEAMLYKKPMVVAYRLNWLSYYLIRALVKVKHVSLPNLLADSAIIPECLQADCRPERLAREIMNFIGDSQVVTELEKKYMEIHKDLKRNSGETAAAAVLQLAGIT